MNHLYNKQTKPSSDNGVGSDDDHIMTSIYIIEPFNALFLQQNIGNVQHEEPPWTEHENISHQDQENDNHIKISPANQLKRDHDTNNRYKVEEVQNEYESKADIAALRMENKRLKVDNDGLRANDKSLQQQLTGIQYANGNKLNDDHKYDNNGDDENLSNVARSSVSPPQSQQNEEQKLLIDDVNDNKDQNEAEVAAPSEPPLPCIDTAVTETPSLDNNVFSGVHSMQLPYGQILTGTETKVSDINDNRKMYLLQQPDCIERLKESSIRDEEEKESIDVDSKQSRIPERQIYTSDCEYCCECLTGNKDVIQLITFYRKLVLERGIIEEDLNQSNWSNLKLVGSESVDYNPINLKSVIKEYCSIALMRLNNSNNDVIDNLIPIAVIDQQHIHYGIEWVLIVPVIHRNCNVGLAFSYHEKTDAFIPTAIYLDEAEIERKHNLIGLTQSFDLKKFQCTDENDEDDEDQDEEEEEEEEEYDAKISSSLELQSDYGDDDDIYNDNYYKKMYEIEQLKNLQQQMLNTKQIYVSWINALQQEQQYIINQLQMQQIQQNMAGNQCKEENNTKHDGNWNQ